MNEDEFYDMYLDAIKKARPVDALVFPVFNYSGKHTGYRIDCPMCGRSIYGVTTRTQYCSFCGQKLRKVGENGMKETKYSADITKKWKD